MPSLYSRRLAYEDSQSASLAVPQPEDSLSADRPLKSEAYMETVRMIGDYLMTCSGQVERPLLVGVNGIDTSGKTEFTRTVADHLLASKQPHVVAHVDDFMNPKNVRHQSDDELDNYYNNMIDFTAIKQQLLVPVRQGKQVDVTFNHPHPADDNLRIFHRYATEGTPTVLITEGVFLFRESLRNLFDVRIFLDVSLDSVMQRARARDYSWGGEAVMEKYRSKYIPTQQMYMALAEPALHAHIVINMSDLTSPSIEGSIPKVD